MLQTLPRSRTPSGAAYLARGEGDETLVLIHGVGMRIEAWQPQIDRLATRLGPVPELVLAALGVVALGVGIAGRRHARARRDDTGNDPVAAVRTSARTPEPGAGEEP